MKQNKLGCVNPCNMCSLLDADDKVLGYTLDTPNAIAYAMATNTKCVKATSFYPLFGDHTTQREDLKDRFGFVVKEGAILSKHLKWC
jgi:hypothetical protein